jgi:hypothetical protein
MHEILISNGFTHKGKCKVCGGQAEEYFKIVNGRTWTAKVKINSDRGTLTGPKGIIRFFQVNLLNVLQHNGLVQQEVGS